MNIVHAAAKRPRSRWGTAILVSVLSSTLWLAICPQTLFAEQDAPPPQAPPHAQQTPDQLQQLVAPIALYPDSLVAQILAASTFPEQVVEADRWLQANPELERRRVGSGDRPTAVGPQRQGAHGIPVGPGQYGQESLLDVLPGRRLLQSATGCHGCRASDAPAGASGGQSAVHSSANGGRPEHPRLPFSRRAPRWFTFPLMIRGWFTVIPWSRGRGGTRTRESGLAVRTSPLESASISVSWGLLAGAGVSGDSTGVAAILSTTTTGITRGATRFTTAIIITVAEASAASQETCSGE